MKYCKYHIIWITKYRKKYLYGKIKSCINKYLFIKAKQLNIVIENLEIMPEHIHLFISIPTTICISKVVSELKGYSSYYTRKKLNLYNYKYFWSKGYFCESVGHISEKTIKNYINNQWAHYKIHP